MGWGDPQGPEAVDQTEQTSRIGLLPGEKAHVQVDVTNDTDRARIEVRATLSATDDTYDVTPLFEFRVEPGDDPVSFIVFGVFAFAVFIENDEASPTQTVTTNTSWRLDTVDLTTAL